MCSPTSNIGDGGTTKHTINASIIKHNSISLLLVRGNAQQITRSALSLYLLLSSSRWYGLISCRAYVNVNTTIVSKWSVVAVTLTMLRLTLTYSNRPLHSTQLSVTSQSVTRLGPLVVDQVAYLSASYHLCSVLQNSMSTNNREIGNCICRERMNNINVRVPIDLRQAPQTMCWLLLCKLHRAVTDLPPPLSQLLQICHQCRWQAECSHVQSVRSLLRLQRSRLCLFGSWCALHDVCFEFLQRWKNNGKQQ